MELKAKIKALRQKLSECGQCERDSETFTSAIRRFMRMDFLTAPLLRELIDHIDVFETEGTGKSRTQRIVIYYRFVGYVEIPEVSQRPASKQTPEKALPWSISPSRKQHNKKSRRKPSFCYAVLLKTRFFPRQTRYCAHAALRYFIRRKLPPGSTR